jgi:hypothetical protein
MKAVNGVARTWRESIVWMFLVGVIVGVLCQFYQPIHFHYGGTDASNYVNRSVIQVQTGSAKQDFYPPEVKSHDYDLLDKTFTMKGRSIWVEWSYVGAGHKIEYAHPSLFGKLMSLPRYLFSSKYIAGYTNYLFLFLSMITFFVLMRNLGQPLLATSLGTLVVFLSPAFLVAARYPLTELMTCFLLWAMVLSYVSLKKDQRHLAALWLVPLMLTRREYSIIYPIFLLYAGVTRNGWRVAALILLGDLSLELFNPKPWQRFIPMLKNSIDQWSPLWVFLGATVLSWPYRRYLNSKFIILKDKLLTRPKVWITSWFIFWLLVGSLDLLRLNGFDFYFGNVRYGTFSTISFGAGLFLLIGGALGWTLWGRTVFQRLPGVVALLLAPQFMVFVTMQATPENPWYWTRRLVPFVIPWLGLGLVLLLGWVQKRVDEKFVLRPLPAIMVGTAALVAVFAMSLEAYKRMPPTDYLVPKYLDQFHADAADLPSESVVILKADPQTKGGALPLRTFHNIYSYIVWNSSQLKEALKKFSGQRPILIDERLLEHLALEFTHMPKKLRIPFSSKQGGTYRLHHINMRESVL